MRARRARESVRTQNPRFPGGNCPQSCDESSAAAAAGALRDSKPAATGGSPGRSNAGVASALVLALGTVEKHVASIFGKLGLPACQTDNRRVLAVLRYLGS